MGAMCLALVACPNALSPPPTGAQETAQLLSATSATADDPHADFLQDPSASFDTHFCLGCHDGTVAPNILDGACMTPSCAPSSHPIGGDYQIAKLLRPGARLRDMALLPPPVKLENGGTGCLSCHDPASSLPSRLVIDNTESRLCYACHDM